MEGKKVILLLSIAMTELQKLLIIKLHAKYLVQSQEQVDAHAKYLVQSREQVDALALCCHQLGFFSSKYATIKFSD